MQLSPTPTDTFREVYQNLNEAQRKAVDTIEGPVLVLAGPGTGKTQVLSARIGHILDQTDTGTANILCLTFTEAAAAAMRERLLTFIGPEAYNVHIYTFHGFCAKVIRDNPDYFGFKDWQPVSDLEEVEFLQKLIRSFPQDHILKNHKNPTYVAQTLKGTFSLMKQENWKPDQVIKAVDDYIESLPDREEYQYKQASKKKNKVKGDLKDHLIKSEVEKVEKLKAAADEFGAYQKILQENNRFEYHDMISWVIEALEKHESLLLRYQEQFLYILVDEYQDTNNSQNTIVNLLSSYWEVPNVFVVGDDDQSIYRFQGANMANILSFCETYSSFLELVCLENNYRSTQPVLDASDAVIKNNQDRLINTSGIKEYFPDITKKLKSSGAVQDGPQPKVVAYQGIHHESWAILEKIKAHQAAGDPLNEIAILYRNHSQVDSLVKHLEQADIPLNIRKRLNVLELPLVKQLVNILEMLSLEYKNQGSGDSLLFEIMHYPYFELDFIDISRLSRYIYTESKEEKRLSFRESMKKLKQENDFFYQQEKMVAFFDMVEGWLKYMPTLTLQLLLEKVLTTGKVISTLMRSEEKSWNMQVLSTFFDFLKEESVKDPDISPGRLVEIIHQMNENNISMGINRIIFNQEGVHFITAHSAKGLEFETVYLMGCTADKWEEKRGFTSHYKVPDTLIASKEDHKEEDERRLFYVAMTRAKKHLEISYPDKKDVNKPFKPSRFTAEILDSGMAEMAHPSVSENDMIEYLAQEVTFNLRVDEELIDHNLVNQVMETFRMSVTSLNKYLKCPLSFYFENILRVPAARNKYMGYGSAIHQAMEDYFRSMIQNKHRFPGKELLKEIYKDALKKYRSHFTPEEYEDFLHLGQQTLADYHDEYEKSWHSDVKLEFEIKEVLVHGVPITGKLDKIEVFKNQVNVVDYKTGNPDNSTKKLKAPADGDDPGGDYWRQIVFYKLLLDRHSGTILDMVSGEMDFIEKSKRKDAYLKSKIVVRPEDLSLVENQIVTAYQGMKDHRFDGCGEDDCMWCNFAGDYFNPQSLDLKNSYAEEEP